MSKEFAQGLPSKTEFAPINQKGRTRLVIQKHVADKAGKHYDMRLQGPGGIAHSWVIKALPGERSRMLAIQQPTHTSKYMNFKGKIESGYGAGTVSKAYDKKVRVLSASNDRIKMVLPEGTFTMIKPKNFGKGDKNWLMIKNAAYIDELEKIAKEKKKEHNVHPYLLAQAGGYTGSRLAENTARGLTKNIKSEKLKTLAAIGGGALGLSGGLLGGYYAGKKVGN